MLDRDILVFEPWDGGKGDDRFRVLRDHMVVAKYGHRCQLCCGDIAKGERHRARTELSEDGSHQVTTFRFCALCCEAMARSWKDDGDAICARAARGMSARLFLRRQPGAAG